MAGTLFGLGLSQQHDINGVPMSGALLFLYEANTSTPVTAYRNTGLTAGQELPWPVEADANGRIPAFWLADGSYRARLTDADGVVQFDEQNILAVGASSGSGGADTTDPNSIATTGDVSWRPVNTTRSGWVRLNGRNIGNATSGASERANADTQSLFEYLYANFSDTLAPVSGGRGASAAVDYAASKTITLLDMRGRSPLGVDDMGNSAVGAFGLAPFATGNATTGGSSGGENAHTLTTAEMPAHTHTGTTVSDGAHTHGLEASTPGASSGAGLAPTTSFGAGGNVGLTESDGAHTHTFTTASAGGGSAHNLFHNFTLGTWFMRL